MHETKIKAEWDCPLYTRDNTSSLCTWKELDGKYNGLVILPDGTDASVMNSIMTTADLATHGAVFLPAAGYRDGTGVNGVGSLGHYWSSTPLEGYEGYAYFMYFGSGDVGTVNGFNRGFGYAVRLVW